MVCDEWISVLGNFEFDSFDDEIISEVDETFALGYIS